MNSTKENNQTTENKELPSQEIPIPGLPGVTITSSSDILGPQTRIAQLLWAASGYGKTHLSGQLDALTQKYGGKRTLFIAVEAGEGGGAATLRNLNIPICVPKDYNDLYRILGLLKNDKGYGGVVFDSATELNTALIKPAALKYPSRENSPVRAVGVPTRNDYQTMGEMMSQVLRALMAFTTHENPEYRKHLIITAADMTREEDEKVTFVGPALPGRMARETVQLFNQVGTITIKPQVVNGKRENIRYLTFTGDGVKALKDRYKIYPPEMQLRGDSGEGETLTSMYEKYWLPAIKEK